jgi:hypothetical protein
MDTRTDHTCDWPQTLHTDAAGRLWIEGADGQRMELGAFKDECRRRAAEMRALAISDAMGAVAHALGRWIRSASGLVLPQQRQHAAFQGFHSAGQLGRRLFGDFHVLLKRRQ